MDFNVKDVSTVIFSFSVGHVEVQMEKIKAKIVVENKTVILQKSCISVSEWSFGQLGDFLNILF